MSITVKFWSFPMKIGNVSDSSQASAWRSTSTATGGSDFQSLLARAQQASGGSPTITGQVAAGSAAEASAKQAGKAEAAKAAHDAALAEFNDYMKKTPMEHLRDAVLKEMGVTEDDLAAMPPEKRQAMEGEIARRIKEKLLAKQDEGDAPKTTQPPAVEATADGTGNLPNVAGAIQPAAEAKSSV